MPEPDLAELYPERLYAPTAALVRASIALTSALSRAAVEPAGLDAATADLIVRLAVAPNHCLRGIDIGRELQIGPTRVSRLVDRGEQAGLVERRPDPHDRRAQEIVLTRAGKDAAVRYAPLMGSVIDRVVFDSFTASEQRTLIELLDRLASAADQIEGTAE